MALLSYTEKYRLREMDMDYKDNIRASSLLDLFQTIAGKHANMLGIGFDDSIAKGLIWVITKFQCDCLRPLRFDEVVSVETCPLPKGLIDYNRDYYVYGEDGELAVKASSQWVLLNFETRRIERPILDYEGEYVDKRAYESKRLERVAPFSGGEPYVHRIVTTDLDHNAHTNNIKYADMCVNAADMPALPLKRLVVNFISESRLGDTIEICHKCEDGAFLFTGTRGGENCFTAKFVF